MPIYSLTGWLRRLPTLGTSRRQGSSSRRRRKHARSRGPEAPATMSHTSQGGQYQRSSSAPSETLSTRPGTTPGKSACHTFSALHLSLAHALGARRSTDPASTGRWYGERSKGHGLKDPGFVDSAGSTGPWYGGRIKGHGLKDLGEGAKPVAEVPDVNPPWFAHPMSKTEDPGTSNAGQPSAARPATQGQAQPQWAVRRMPPTAGVASVQQRRITDLSAWTSSQFCISTRASR